MPTPFRVTLVTPEQQVLEEDVTYASIPAWDGQIGFEHLRAPILLKLGQGLLRLDSVSGGQKWFYLGGGFAQMKDDKLTLLTGEAVPATAADKAKAEAELTKALAEVPTSDDALAKKERETHRARGLLELAEKK